MSNIRIPNRSGNETEQAKPKQRNTATPPPFVPRRQPVQPASTPASVYAASENRPKRSKGKHPNEEHKSTNAPGAGDRSTESTNARRNNDAPAQETWSHSCSHPLETGEQLRDELPSVLNDNGMAETAGGSVQTENQMFEAGEASADLEMLANETLPKSGDDGIFEVILPGGKTLGVAVSVQPGLVRLHLSPADQKLNEWLRRSKTKMELHGHLERRMEKSVEITVL